jgi:hypothetical protein
MISTVSKNGSLKISLDSHPDLVSLIVRHRLFRQPVMLGGHHRLPRHFSRSVLSGLWAVKAALYKEKTFGQYLKTRSGMMPGLKNQNV